MTNDPGIICFRHCTSDNIFCKSVPQSCPICRMSNLDFNIAPFHIPYPFTNAVHEPTTLAIRPSEGTFLDNYNINNDLHIAVVNSEGIIFEFDKTGLILDRNSKWTDCITFKIVPSSWNYHWDETLKSMSSNDKWKSYNYDSVHMNCFDFVLEFLGNLNYKELAVLNKEDLCNKLILPKVQDAFRYIMLYRKLKNNEYIIKT